MNKTKQILSFIGEYDRPLKTEEVFGHFDVPDQKTNVVMHRRLKSLLYNMKHRGLLMSPARGEWLLNDNSNEKIEKIELLPEIRRNLYELIEAAVKPSGDDINLNQNIKAVIKRTPTEKAPIQIFQIQNVTITNVVMNAINILKLLDDMEV